MTTIRPEILAYHERGEENGRLGWLVGRGYAVTLVDPVPLHVRRAAARPGVTAVLGDARSPARGQPEAAITCRNSLTGHSRGRAGVRSGTPAARADLRGMSPWPV